ncbi:hypothetical protein [Natronobacterium texcoconense]|uniref:Uncharacterized protein n=1 Tax=Natronobacterium texcoconense TaxID=1095778 RepID=A0A1H1C480_NATTX|nr:hypothetical protein [Natronobacterium texcoconense]SDQ58850.1 hypothetical protein SAMN04489842_1258 [Natronobacterium texcoconense]
MVSRRKLLGGVATASLLSLSGCLANMDVVNYYKKADQLFQAAEVSREEGELEDAMFLYGESATYFESARELTENEHSERFCYEAREVARIHEEATEAMIEEHDPDDDETWDVPDDISEYVEPSDRRKLDEYEIRYSAALERRTRLPSSS